MIYKPGQRIVITVGPFRDIKGTVTAMGEGNQLDDVWAIWDDTHMNQRVPLREVKLACRFRPGDVIQVGKSLINVPMTGELPINEDEAILVSRKQLI